MQKGQKTMKKKIIILLILLLLMSSTINGAFAKKVFLTSDNIIGEKEDKNMLNSIKNYIEELSNGEITVIVDSKSPGPGEGARAIESNADVRVNIAASDAANFIALSKYSVNSTNKIIFVNTGDFDLDNENSLRRAWDDDYSTTTFAGLNSPGKFLNNAGIQYIQPLKQYPNAGHKGYLDQNNDEVNKYIAKKIVENINTNNTKKLDENLIIKHSLSPSEMAKASHELVKSNDKEMNGTYNKYTAPQTLYLTSSYLNGNGLKEPINYEGPSNPEKYSLFQKGSYSINDYMKMGGIVKNYMDEHGRAPDYIEYEGARISYYDLVYNFAKITQDHDKSSNMDFEREYSFDTVNESLISNILPYIIPIIIIILACVGLRRVLRR